MADFCKQCCKEIFGMDTRDLSGLSTEKDTAKKRYAMALCEGCGFILVDHTGKRIRKAKKEKRDAKAGTHG